MSTFVFFRIHATFLEDSSYIELCSFPQSNHVVLPLVQVMRDLSSSDDYRDSLEELDTALCEMASHPSFPQVVDFVHVPDKLSFSLFFMLLHLLSSFHQFTLFSPAT